jgi:hypothetical protein
LLATLLLFRSDTFASNVGALAAGAIVSAACLGLLRWMNASPTTSAPIRAAFDEPRSQ